jgi:copper transport protein
VARCAAATVAAGAFGLAVAAPPAGAHAMLMSTDPASGATVAAAPERVVLRFSERVEPSLVSVQVVDTDGGTVDTGDVAELAGDAIAVSVPEAARAHGTHTVTWQVVSEDTHPVRGAFVFHVGAPTAAPAAAAHAAEADAPPRYVDVAFAGVRFAAFGLLLLCAGGVAALAVVLRDAGAGVMRRLALLLVPAGLALAVVSAVGVVLQGAAATGTGVVAALHADVLRGVATSGFGRSWLARAAVALVLAAAAWWLARAAGGHRTAPLVVAGAAAICLVSAPAASGHARAAGSLAMATDVAHVAAAAAWTGGLAFTVLALRWAGYTRWALAEAAVPRFSTMAVASVAVLLAAGAARGYVELPALDALWTTTYGKLLVAKVLLVMPLLALGAYNKRHLMPRILVGPAVDAAARPLSASGADLRRLRRRFLRATGAELAVMVVIVAVTAVLVAEPPVSASAGRGPFQAMVTTGDLRVSAVVTPARAGQNRIELEPVSHSGRRAHIDEVHALASLPGADIGPLRLEFHRRPGGRYVAGTAPLVVAGDWQLRLELRRGEFDLETGKLTIPIAAAS